MWSQYYQPNVSQLLRKSILSLCSENVPYEDKLEVDGIICISKGTEGDHIVVKLHEVLDALGKESWKYNTPEGQFEPREETAIKPEPDEEEIFTIVKDESPLDCRMSYSLNSRTADTSAANSDDADATRSSVHTRNGAVEEDAINGSNCNSNRAHVLPSLDIFSSSSYQENCDDYQSSSQGSSDHPPGDLLCRVCGSRFSNFSGLSAHAYDIHGRFTCKQCLNTFSMLCNLKRHERLHAGRKPYTCATCGKGFSRNSDLRLHETKRHKGVEVHEGQLPVRNQKESLPVKNNKSSSLCDILSKLSQKRMLNVQKNEGRSRRKYRSAFKPKDYSVIDLSSDIENSIADKTSDAEDQAKNTNDVDEGTGLDIMLETDRYLEEKGHSDPSVSVPMPLFTRSILRSSGGSEPNSASDQPKIIHIIPNNNTSGGHMEEPIDVKTTYSPSFLSTGSISDSSSNLNTVHGMSVGRIVFPGQGESQEHVDSQGPSYRVTVGKSKELPFRTYLGSKSDDSQRTVSGEDRAHSSSPSTYQPPSPCYGGSSSRSNSPVALPKDDQTDVPAFISLDREYWCRTCRTQWGSFRGYEQHHVQQHLRYPCQFCDQTFSNKNNRSRHIRSHTGQREHTCQECGKSFSRSDTLREHQIIHTDGYLGDKCNYCSLVIKKKAELLGHIKKCSQRQKHRYSDAVVDTASPSAYSE